MELQSELSKKYLADALLNLLKNKDYNSISIQDIVDKAGMSRMAYYRNFNSKDDILKYYIDNITNNFIIETQIKYDSKDFKNYIITLFHHLLNYKDIGKILINSNMIYYVKDEFDKIFSNLSINKKQKYNNYFISGGLFNIYYYWLLNNCIETPEELADMFIDFLK